MAFAQTAVLAQTAASPMPGSAPSGGYAKGVQLVQRIDDGLFGVDPLSLIPVGSRFVSGIQLRVSAGAPITPPHYSHFLADCEWPMRLATLSRAATPFDLTAQGASMRARAAAANAALAGHPAAVAVNFLPLATLDASRAVAEFACTSSQRPAQAAQIAQSLFAHGGPADLRSALCDLRPDGASATREDVEVRFSDSEKVVAVDKQWLSSGKVSDTEISFGSGAARWTIDRATAEATLIGNNGRVMFAGSCVAGPPPQR